MTRIFLTRLGNPFTRTVLLVSAPWVCLACATPFPIESIEEGMTMMEATEAFGEPRSTSVGTLHEAVQLLQKENARVFERLDAAVGPSDTGGPVARELKESSTQTLLDLEWFVAELDRASGEHSALSTWVYPHEEARWFSYPGSILLFGLPLIDSAHLEKQEIDLIFEGNQLVSWETRVLSRAFENLNSENTYVYQNPFPSNPFPFSHHHYQSKKDIRHHKKGHKHHH